MMAAAHLQLVTSAKEDMFLPVSVCQSVCQQDYSKSNGPVLKFYGMVGHNPGTTLLDFSGNPDAGIF